jgi:uncharacterized protein (DUF1778 family)
MSKLTTINIRASKDDKALLKLAAYEEGLSVSAFLIRLGKDRARDLGVTLKDAVHPNQSNFLEGGE